jgi:hypothetical protein
MKKLFLSLFFAVIAISLSAFDITLSLSPPCALSPMSVGYKIYYTPVASNTLPYLVNYTDPCSGIQNNKTYYTNSFLYADMVNNTTNWLVTIPNLIPGTTYAFAATMVNGNSYESDFSPQTLFTLPPAYVSGGPSPQLYLNSITPNTFRLTSNMLITTNWTLLSNSALGTTNWSVYTTGSNSIICVTITNSGNNAFFQIKI